ncbi:MAG: glucose-6-phosphate isomerase [Woeseiaceae bacterium]|nr:glucose-6-phosphate isomerase [Woeseiaceae bacterium]
MPDAILTPRYPTDLPAWQALKAHHRNTLRNRSLTDLFDRDKKRTEHFSLDSGDLHLDYSKNYLTAETRKLLVRLAREARVPQAIEAMFNGEIINATERRPVLHAALRAKLSDQVALDVPGVLDIWRVLDRMESFVQAVHAGGIRGHGGQRLTEIVNIGIGGSDLGPVMASRALRHLWQPGMNFHSVSNVDGTELADLTEHLDPAQTLFVICSKTFTTQETMANAQAARQWIERQLGPDAVRDHFAAASTNQDAMDAFGVHPDYRFGFWDWVGGRYSLWSAVGLSLALVIGMERFQALLSGARRMDLHFRQAKPDENMPLLLAVIMSWYRRFLRRGGARDPALRQPPQPLPGLPAATADGIERQGRAHGWPGVGYPAPAPPGWAGQARRPDAQHSSSRCCAQGTRFVPVDFILPCASSGASQAQQDLAIANCLAQSEALMDGYSAVQARADLKAAGVPAKEAALLAKHKTHPGGRPSNTIVMPALTPETLGQLIALYERGCSSKASSGASIPSTSGRGTGRPREHLSGAGHRGDAYEGRTPRPATCWSRTRKRHPDPSSRGATAPSLRGGEAAVAISHRLAEAVSVRDRHVAALLATTVGRCAPRDDTTASSYGFPPASRGDDRAEALNGSCARDGADHRSCCTQPLRIEDRSGIINCPPLTVSSL